jgi:proteasome-associated ATPase
VSNPTSQDYEELRQQAEALAEELERIATEPLDMGTVVEVEGNDVRVAVTGGHVIVKQPAEKKNKVKPGQSILVHKQSMQFIRPNPFGNEETVAVVTDIIDGKALIEMKGEPHLIPLVDDLKEGDKVLLDNFGSYIVRVLPKKSEGFSVGETGVSWDDIGGNHEAKQAMIEAIENPHLYADLYAFYGAKGAKGILLYGPPGCGKTMLGKAAATALGAADGFIYCKGPEVLDPYAGVAEATVRSLFSRARRFKAETGKRGVIFIDEAEALLGNRGARYAHMEKTIVPTFLAEMDGVEDSGAVVILSTNRNMALDPAVVRDGRIDRKVEISRPGFEDSKEILLTHLKNAPIKTPLEEMSAYIAQKTFEATFQQKNVELQVSNYVSGSLLAGIVEKAKMHAMRRDIAAGTQTGLCFPDVDYGLSQTFQEMGATNLESL